MSTNEVAGIDIRARLDQFAADMAAIPGIGAKEAKLLVAQLSKEVKQAEAITKKALEENKRAAEASRKAGDEAAQALKKEAEAAADAAEKLLDITASADPVAKLTREFEKQKKEIEELGKVTKDQAGAQRALAAAEANHKKALDEVTSGTKKFGDASGTVGSNAAKLAGILDMIVPGAGDAARALNDAADGGEVAAEVMESLGLESVSLTAVMGPVAIAVAALGAAYLVISASAQVAEEAMRRSEAVAEAAGAQAKARTDLQTELTDQYLQAIGAQSSADVSAREAKKKLDETTRQSVANLNDQAKAAKDAAASLPKLRAEIERLQEAQDASGDSDKAPPDNRARIASLQAEASAAENLAGRLDLLNQGIAGVEERASQQSAMIDQTLEIAKKKEEEAKATEAAAKAEALHAAQTALMTKVNQIAARGMSEAAQATVAYEEEIRALTEEAQKAHVPLSALEPALHQLAQEHAFSAQMAEADAWAQGEFAKRVNPNISAIKKLNAEIEALTGKTNPAAQKTIDFAMAEADLALALSRGTISLKEYQEQLAKLDAAEGKVAADAAKKADAIVREATGSELDAYQKLADEKAQKLADYLEAAKAAGRSEQEIAAETAAISAGYAKQAADLQSKQAQDIAEKTASYAQQGLEMLSASLTDSYQVAADSVQRLTEQLAAGEGYYTEAQKKELEERIAAQKSAAEKSFEAQKAARMAETIISTASSIMHAWNDGLATGGPAGPIVGAAFAGVAAAAGVTQLAVISGEQPSFHKGGPLDLAPDEMSIKARREEWMLNPTGRRVYGDQELYRSNAGISPKSSKTMAVSVYRHNRMVDTWKFDGLQGGDPIAAAIMEGKMVGQRSQG
jgi:hypothetical protein